MKNLWGKPTDASVFSVHAFLEKLNPNKYIVPLYQIKYNTLVEKCFESAHKQGGQRQLAKSNRTRPTKMGPQPQKNNKPNNFNRLLL